MAGWAIGLGVASVGMQLFGASKAANAGAKAAQQQNEAMQRQHAYDLEAWDMSKKRLQDQHENTVKSIDTKKENEERTARYHDAMSGDRYNYDMMIRNRQQQSLNDQYWKSDDLFHRQVNLNARTAYTAELDEIRQMKEIEAEIAFDAEEAFLESLMAQGKADARGISGRSAGKTVQSILAQRGRTNAMLKKSLLSGGLNTRAMLKEISKDHEAADMAAEAQKMLDPGVLPLPLVPYKVPRATFLYPDPLEDYDFGPRPVMGATMSAQAARDMAWAQGISGIAGTMGSMGAATIKPG